MIRTRTMKPVVKAVDIKLLYIPVAFVYRFVNR